MLGENFRVYGDWENPLFLAKDVAAWIEYDVNQVGKMLAMVDEDEKLTLPILRSGQNREMWFLTEEGLYEVLMQSQKPIAKEFKKQVKAILKEVRKTGMYQVPSVEVGGLEQTLQLARALLDMNELMEADRPKVLLADTITATEDCILIGDFAKMLQQRGIDIGEKRLFQRFRDDGYLLSAKGKRRNHPSQKSVERGLFQLEERVFTKGDGTIGLDFTTKLTGKGQAYFVDLFLGTGGSRNATSLRLIT